MKLLSLTDSLKDSAKKNLAGKYYSIIMTLLFFFMVNFLSNRTSYNLTRQICLTLMRLFSLSEDSILILIMTYLFPLFCSVLSGILQVGLCLFFLNIACNKPYNTFDLFYGYFNQMGKYFCLSGIMTLLSFVCTLPVNILLDYYQQSYTIPKEILVFTLIAQIVLSILFIPISMAISQCYYISLDFPELSAIEIIKHSVRLMRGKKFQLFVLDLSFLPLLLLSLLSFGAGFLWFIPYRSMTHALFFLNLMGDEATVSNE